MGLTDPIPISRMRLFYFGGISLAQWPFNLSLTLTQEMISAWKCIFHICKTIEWSKFILAVTDEVTADTPAEHVSGAYWKEREAAGFFCPSEEMERPSGAV